MDPQAPPVVAVVVTADPGAWLEETLRGLAEQDYPNLSVLVVDSGSAEETTGRIAGVLPSAYVRRLDRPVGYAAAANEAMAAVEGASFFLMCHDDVVLDPDAVRQLVEEAYRSNAGVVCPKLVAWEDPARLLQVGMSADKAGVAVPLAQPGELDQEQHDAVRDVFVAPGAATLIRSDLFTALGGFDPEMVLYGEDLDLCWRAQVAGARVLVAPAARARHLAATSSGMRALQALPGVDPSRPAQLLLRRRHELRSALTCYGFWHLLRVLPQLAAHSVAEIAVGLATRHPEAARASAAAWTWNLRRLGDLRERRRRVSASRTLPDHEVRLLQSAGSARLAGLAEGLFARAATHVPLPTPEAAAVGEGRPWWPSAVGTAVLLFLLIGSRSVLSGGPAAVGSVARFGSFGHLLGAYASSTVPAGLGQLDPAPLALAFSGLVSFVLAGSSAAARDLLVLGMLPLGAWGAHRLARPLRSNRAALVAPVVYLALPFPYSALTGGRWRDLVAYGAAPWILGLLARAGGLAPYSDGTSPQWRRALILGLVLALSGAVSPGLVPVAILTALALAVGSLLVGGSVRAGRAVGATLAGAVVAWLLAFPWSASVVSPTGSLQAVLGLRPAPVHAPGLGALLGLEAGSGGTHGVGWALLAGMAVPLFFGRDWRFAWATRLWVLALAAWALAWVGDRGWIGSWAPPTGALLALAGAGLSLSACLGVVAFERDLVGYHLGWRQALSVVGVAGVALGIFGALGHAGDGRWGSAPAGFDSVLSTLPGYSARSGFQELWVGDPRALPGSGWVLSPGVGYLTSSGGGLPDVSYDWPPSDPGRAELAAADIRRAESGRTGLVGEPLAALGVRYVLVPTTNAPGGPPMAPPPALVAALGRQLDLRPMASDPSVLVYANADWRPGAGPSPPTPDGTTRALSLLLEGLLWAGAVAAVTASRSRRRGRRLPSVAPSSPAPPAPSPPPVPEAATPEAATPEATAPEATPWRAVAPSLGWWSDDPEDEL